MKVAIIGATSFLAGYLIEQLRNDKSCHLTLFGRKDPLQHHKPKLNHFSWKYPHTEHDFYFYSYPDRPLEANKLLPMDAIIYCVAAGVQSTPTPAAVDSIYAINATQPITLLQYLYEQKWAGKFISFGSFWEIGNNEEVRGFTEEEIVTSQRPVPNDYCASKRQLSAYIANTNPGVQAYHLILPTIYGVKENEKRFIPYILRSLSEGQKPQLSSGEQVREYLHATDVVRLVELLLKGDYTPGVYNVGNGEPVKIADLARKLFALFGQDAAQSLGTLQTRDETMKVLLLDNSKLRASVPEWNPTISLDEGLKEYLPMQNQAQ